MVTCTLRSRLLRKLVAGSTTGPGRCACVPEEETESEESEELSEVREDRHSWQGEERVGGQAGPHAETGCCDSASRTKCLEPRGGGRRQGWAGEAQGPEDARLHVLRMVLSSWEEFKQERGRERERKGKKRKGRKEGRKGKRERIRFEFLRFLCYSVGTGLQAKSGSHSVLLKLSVLSSLGVA